MARDIDIDIDELEKFISVLKKFQDKATDEFKTLKSAWSKCDETWKGDAKEDFTKGFEKTERVLEKALEDSDDYIHLLTKLYEKLLRFERK